METEEILEETVEESMDEPLFVCETVIDVKTQGEASKAASGKSALIMSLVTYITCLAMVVYLVVDSILNDCWDKNGLMLVLAVGVMVYAFFSRKNAPKKALLRWEAAIRRKFGTPALHITTEFYELSLAQTLQEDEEQFLGDGYSSILELKETENLFLLRHSKNQYYFVSKAGFTKGTAEEFRKFIQEKIGG